MSNLVERWMDVGFTEYEAKAYVALLRLGSATGYQVAKESGVPRSMVYEILNKLVARGAVATQSFTEAVRYAPVPPDHLLGRMRRELEDNLTALTHDLKGVATGSTAPGGTWNLAGRKNVLAYARQMIEKAQREVTLVVGDDDELDELLPQLQEAHARGVALVVISPVAYDAGDVPIVVYPHGQSLRQATGHGLALIVDGSELLIGEVDRSESAAWTTNGFAVALILWCLKREMAGLSESRSPYASRPKRRSAR
jgi:HTH-type transcriptional regulator, sugar sensing transcriptional regulator